MNEELPPLPPIDPKDSLPYSAIRYIAGYPASFVERYALTYGKACAEAATLRERERAASLAEACSRCHPDDAEMIAAAIRKGDERL